MQAIRIILLFLLVVNTNVGNAQVLGGGPLTDIKRNLLNSTIELTQIRNRFNDRVKDTITNKRLYFTKDSVFLTSENVKMQGVWSNEGISFVLSAIDKTKLSFQWLNGDENNFCFIINNNRNRRECYKKLK